MRPGRGRGRVTRGVWMDMKWINIHISEIHASYLQDRCLRGSRRRYPPHMEDGETQGAYRQSRTKGETERGGREGEDGCGGASTAAAVMRTFLSVIALCGGSSGEDAGGNMVQIKQQLMKMWHIVHRRLLTDPAPPDSVYFPGRPHVYWQKWS